MNNEMDEIIELAGGNPGALNFLIEILSPQTGAGNIHIILTKIKRCKTLKGTNLYALYSDLCKKDMNKVANLCLYCPDDVLEDACSRQDYSGLELVAQYFE